MNVVKEVSSNIEVNKSKFIALLIPTNSVDDFNERLKTIKKDHKKARHVVYAYHIKDAYKSNDDGEPHGTAGRPLLELLMKKEAENCALVVIRYFGGTKLGAGRLLRTYVSAGVEAFKKLESENI